jgi:hypothetical protein
MATPAMQTLQTPIQLNTGTPNVWFFPTKDLAGTTIDVSAGYTVVAFGAKPSANPNPQQSGYANLASHATVSFGATGVTATLSQAQSVAMSQALDSLNLKFVLAISNDAGATQSVPAAGQLQVNNAPNFL